MIATVVFLAEVPVFEGVLMSDVRSAAMCKGTRQVLMWAGAGLEDVELMGCEWGRA